ncbi:MAG: hypothetical protein IK015_04285 [Treponema sp.]|nr:hypothetical protein [Treponema sp.]
MTFNRFTLLDLLSILGEEKVQKLISSFSCPKNGEICQFINNNATNFAKRKITVTHLILDDAKRFRAFFSLTHKPLSISEEFLTGKAKRIFERYTSYNPLSKRYEASGFLIAQLAKNFSYDDDELSGDSLIETIIQILLPIQHEIGGRILYLECDKSKPKLLDFYKRNKFEPFKERHDNKDGVTYVQMLRVL